jgi:hypothetical protein
MAGAPAGSGHSCNSAGDKTTLAKLDCLMPQCYPYGFSCHLYGKYILRCNHAIKFDIQTIYHDQNENKAII